MSKAKITDIEATGTPGSTTFLRGDGSWQTPSSMPGNVLLASYSGAAASRADIALPSGYSRLTLVLHATFSADGGNLTAQVTTDNFATVKSGASAYNYNSWRANTSTYTNTTSNAASSIVLATNKGNAAGDDMMGTIAVFFAGDAAKITRLIKSLTYGIGGSASPGVEQGDGAYLTAEAVNGIRIAPSTGTFTYEIYVYGDLDA